MQMCTAYISCIHAGLAGCLFIESTPTALDALVGACQEYYTKFLNQLRYNVDTEALTGHTGFQVLIHIPAFTHLYRCVILYLDIGDR